MIDEKQGGVFAGLNPAVSSRPKNKRRIKLNRLVRRGNDLRGDKHLPRGSHRNLVKAIARRYARGGGKFAGDAFDSLDRDDLEQEGMIGLIRAWDTFDPDRRVPFDRWATNKIRGGILDALRDQGRTLRLPKDANTEYLTYRRVIDGFTQRHGTAPTDAQIAVRMQTTVERVRKIGTYAPRMVDLEGPAGSEDEGLRIEETIPEGTYTLTDHTDAVEKILDSMPGRDAFLLESSLGLYTRKASRARLGYITDLTLREVATELQRIKRGLRKDLRVLALKEATGYETWADLKARSERLPKHAAAPRPKRPARILREPAPVRCYTLSEAERVAVVARCEERWMWKRRKRVRAWENPFLATFTEWYCEGVPWERQERPERPPLPPKPPAGNGDVLRALLVRPPVVTEHDKSYEKGFKSVSETQTSAM